MNIFILDDCVKKSAQYLTDIHLNKMIIEHVQMLTNCFTLDSLKDFPKTQLGNVRKYSYYNHLCSVWVRQSFENFKYLRKYTIEMLKEREYRGFKEHFCKDFINFCCIPDNLEHTYAGLTPFALAMPDAYKKQNAVESYRAYYINDKQYNKSGKWMMKYTKRELPDWFPESLVQKCKENE